MEQAAVFFFQPQKNSLQRTAINVHMLVHLYKKNNFGIPLISFKWQTKWPSHII